MSNVFSRVRMVALAVTLMAASLSASSAAGTVVVTVNNRTLRGMTQYTLAWTSTAGGAVSANPVSVGPGWIESVKFVPGSGGTQPTDLYDVTLVDTNGVDVLNAQGANLSNATGLYLQFNPPLFFPGSGSSQTLDLVIANAGNAKTGVAYVWIR